MTSSCSSCTIQNQIQITFLAKTFKHGGHRPSMAPIVWAIGLRIVSSAFERLSIFCLPILRCVAAISEISSRPLASKVYRIRLLFDSTSFCLTFRPFLFGLVMAFSNFGITLNQGRLEWRFVCRQTGLSLSSPMNYHCDATDI